MKYRSGFTLVELLVVLVIAATVIAIAIPRIRTVTKERGMREAARVVGSAFANASQRAQTDGVSGVYISRNPSFSTTAGQQFAATEMSLLRKVANYTGNDVGEFTAAIDVMGGMITIEKPFDHDQTNRIIRQGDSISLGSSSTKFRITERPVFIPPSVAPPRPSRLALTVDLQGYLTLPAANTTFVIHRLPRILKSSTVSLPDQYIVDLRFSGFEVLDDGDPTVGPPVPPQLTTVFESQVTGVNEFGVNVEFDNFDIAVIFDSKGGIDQVLYFDTTTGNATRRVPMDSLYLFVTEAPNSFDTNVVPPTGSEESAIWVTVSNTTGSTNIGYSDTSQTAGLLIDDLATMYNAAWDEDPDPTTGLDRFTEEYDRDEFNGLMRRTRKIAVGAAANQ